MLTPTDAADLLNLVLTKAQNSLEADTWLQTGGTGGIGLICPWVVGSQRTYQAHELPALVVRATDISSTSHPTPAGADEVAVHLAVEALDAGADASALMTTVRTIAARLRRWMTDQTVPGGNRLDGFLDDGDGVLVPGTVKFVEEQPVGGTYWVVTQVEAVVRLRVEL